MNQTLAEKGGEARATPYTPPKFSVEGRKNH